MLSTIRGGTRQGTSLKNEDVKSSTNIKMLKLLPREVKLHGYDHTVGYSRIGKKIFLDLD